MVKVDVVLYGALVRVAGKNNVEVEASNLLDVLNALAELSGDFKRRLFDDHCNPRRFINIYVNGRDFRFLKGPETALNEGDTISVIPAVSGG